MLNPKVNAFGSKLVHMHAGIITFLAASAKLMHYYNVCVKM